MMPRKACLSLPVRTPAYVSREVGAGELGISPGTWDGWVEWEFCRRRRLDSRHRRRGGGGRMSTRSSRTGMMMRRTIRQRSSHQATGLTSELFGRSFCSMGRRRVRKMALPEHVHCVKAGGRSYFYYQEGRGRKNREERGARLRIAGNPFAPAGTPDNARFWAELNQIVATRIVYPAKSIGALVNRYRSDDAYLRLEQATRECYDVHLNRFQKPEAWGLLETTRLTPFAVKTARDAIKATPVMANQMLSVGNTLYDWGMLFGLATANPFEKVPPLEVVDRGHIPWPPWALGYVAEHAPADLRRLVRLGVATCQRESDLVRLGPEHRAAVPGGPGIWCRAKKTRRRKRSVFTPLAMADALELDRWASEPIEFTAVRWKKPIRRYRADLYLYSPTGKPYTPDSLRARYYRWLATDNGRKLCGQWRNWLGEMKRRYEWDVDPDDKVGPQSMACAARGSSRVSRKGLTPGRSPTTLAPRARLSTTTCGSRTRWTLPLSAASGCNWSRAKARPAAKVRLYGGFRCPVCKKRTDRM
jgi:hypothetical protein